MLRVRLLKEPGYRYFSLNVYGGDIFHAENICVDDTIEKGLNLSIEALNFFGAEEKIRTSTDLHPHGPEPCVSTNSTTSARSGRDCL